MLCNDSICFAFISTTVCNELAEYQNAYIKSYNPPLFLIIDPKFPPEEVASDEAGGIARSPEND